MWFSSSHRAPSPARSLAGSLRVHDHRTLSLSFRSCSHLLPALPRLRARGTSLLLVSCIPLCAAANMGSCGETGEAIELRSVKQGRQLSGLSGGVLQARADRQHPSLHSLLRSRSGFCVRNPAGCCRSDRRLALFSRQVEAVGAQM